MVDPRCVPGNLAAESCKVFGFVERFGVGIGRMRRALDYAAWPVLTCQISSGWSNTPLPESA